MPYAKKTQVPIERSKAEVEKILQRAGADQFHSGWGKDKAVIAFRMNDRYIRIEMPLPIYEKIPAHSWEREKGHFYSTDAVAKESRRRWRALLLYIKAKVESVESNIVSFEDAFMTHMVLPNRQTVSEFMKPQLEAAYKRGDMPKQIEGY